MSQQQLLDAATDFFTDFSKSATPTTLLSYFSTAHPILIQHAPAFSKHYNASRLSGPNGVRSYFDLVATHWTRAVAISRTEADPVDQTVRAEASIMWSWRRSHRKWTEDVVCTFTYDDSFKIVSLNFQTVSDPETCLMHAVDPSAVELTRDLKPGLIGPISHHGFLSHPWTTF